VRGGDVPHRKEEAARLARARKRRVYPNAQVKSVTQTAIRRDGHSFKSRPSCCNPVYEGCRGELSSEVRLRGFAATARQPSRGLPTEAHAQVPKRARRLADMLTRNVASQTRGQSRTLGSARSATPRIHSEIRSRRSDATADVGACTQRVRRCATRDARRDWLCDRRNGVKSPFHSGECRRIWLPFHAHTPQ
jgi:hypothetical protein